MAGASAVDSEGARRRPWRGKIRELLRSEADTGVLDLKRPSGRWLFDTAFLVPVLLVPGFIFVTVPADRDAVLWFLAVVELDGGYARRHLSGVGSAIQGFLPEWASWDTLPAYCVRVARSVGINQVVSTGGIAVLVAVKTADVVITLTVLTLGVGTEVNPVANALVELLGPVTGLLAGGLAFLAFIIAVTEGSAVWLRRHGYGPRPQASVRLVGYGFSTAVTAWVVVHNALLVARVGGGL